MRRFSVDNHRLVDNILDASFIETPNVSPNRIRPRLAVIHYTASLDANSAIRTLTNPRSRVSAHLVVDRDGEITQLADFDRRCWHAGPSAWNGWTDLNSHSIGIELVNIGWMRKARDGALIDSYGRRHSPMTIGGTIESEHARVGSGVFHWQTYTEAQISATESLLRTLDEIYGLIAALSHEEIDTRGWKTDPGPAFPMTRFRNLVDDHAALSLHTVTAPSLNMRSGPGTNFPVRDTLSHGTAVAVQDVRGDWAMVDADRGLWVHRAYLRAA